jgi:dTDP-glucose 4,6-dehydratase
MTILVTGGAGFIGANFILDWLTNSSERIVTLDALTYAGNRENLASVADHPYHHFVQGNITNRALLDRLLEQYRPRAILHFAAESHVDRSIHDPTNFIHTNITGTFILLEAVRAYWSNLKDMAKTDFRFLHISTDEVFGSLSPSDPAFTETTPYQPNSPYSASKAASDHLVRAWHHTYGLPILTTHCSNNYGPYQFPEKFIPRMITNAMAGEALPIYGDGKHIRDWLYVTDHCAALRAVLARGTVGESYNIGGWNEKTNLEVVTTICALLDRLASPLSRGLSIRSYVDLIAHVTDRPGHDRRYAIDAQKIERSLGWRPSETFDSGIEKTIRWYLGHTEWIAHVQTGAYHQPIQQ